MSIDRPYFLNYIFSDQRINISLVIIFTAAFISVSAPLAAAVPASSSAGWHLNITWQSLPGQYRGTLHGHTTNSDGVFTPAVFLTNYRDNGSDFQAITDHSVITKDPQVKGITYISGSEYSVMSNGGHMNGVWLSGKTTPSTNAVIIAQRIRDSGGKVIFNHPGSPTKGWTFKEIKAAAKPYDFYEMYDPGYPTIESYYDQMLQNNITMWATADDDDHSFKDGRFLKSYDVVNAYNSTSSEIKRQMSLGNFYAAMLDNGSYARINSISTSDGHNVVITSPDMCNFIWYTKDGVVKITNNTNTDSYDANPDDMYVRAELVLDNIPRLKSWTQPMLVENGSLSPTVCYGSLSPTVGLKTTPEYSNVGSIACILFIILIISAGAIAIMVIVRGLRPRN